MSRNWIFPAAALSAAVAFLRRKEREVHSSNPPTTTTPDPIQPFQPDKYQRLAGSMIGLATEPVRQAMAAAAGITGTDPIALAATPNDTVRVMSGTQSKEVPTAALTKALDEHVPDWRTTLGLT